MVLDWALTWESLARDIFWSENGGLWVFGVENLTIRMQNINWKIEIQIYYYCCCFISIKTSYDFLNTSRLITYLCSLN